MACKHVTPEHVTDIIIKLSSALCLLEMGINMCEYTACLQQETVQCTLRVAAAFSRVQGINYFSIEVYNNLIHVVQESN